MVRPLLRLGVICASKPSARAKGKALQLWQAFDIIHGLSIPGGGVSFISPLVAVMLLSITASDVRAQEEPKEKKWALNGYVKDLVTFNIDKDCTLVDNLIHNRLNFEWYANADLTFHLELRNRLFHGDLVESIPNYSELIDTNDDFLDLSITAIDEKGAVLHAMIDRLYMEWYKNDWEVTVGRQRINWGLNLVWNPNDLFNVYSFFDFDYEERPGSDAIRIRRYTGFASGFEIAGNMNDSFDETVLSGMWRVNKGGYDFQLLAGKAREDIALGAGWAGNIKNAGFKGEVSYFHPYVDNALDQTLLASFSIDYSFENSLYLNGSLLYNSDGSQDPDLQTLNTLQAGRLTARDLSPFVFSTFLQASYTFHPLINGGLAIIYYPSQRNTTFWNPNVSVSILPNLDIDLIGQIFLDKENEVYTAVGKLLYFRLKWSF